MCMRVSFYSFFKKFFVPGKGVLSWNNILWGGYTSRKRLRTTVFCVFYVCFLWTQMYLNVLSLLTVHWRHLLAKVGNACNVSSDVMVSSGTLHNRSALDRDTRCSALVFIMLLLYLQVWLWKHCCFTVLHHTRPVLTECGAPGHYTSKPVCAFCVHLWTN